MFLREIKCMWGSASLLLWNQNILLLESQTKMSQRRSRAEISLEVVLVILVCVGSIFGNVLVFYVINKYSAMQTATNIFFSQSCTDWYLHGDVEHAVLDKELVHWKVKFEPGMVWIFSINEQYFGYSLRFKYEPYCFEQISKSCQARLVYQVISK